MSFDSRLLTGEGKSKRLSLSPARLVREVLRLSTHVLTQIRVDTNDCSHHLFIIISTKCQENCEKCTKTKAMPLSCLFCVVQNWNEAFVLLLFILS